MEKLYKDMMSFVMEQFKRVCEENRCEEEYFSCKMVLEDMIDDEALKENLFGENIAI